MALWDLALSAFQRVARPSDYQDVPNEGDAEFASGLTQYMHSMYPEWRALYSGAALTERLSTKGSATEAPLRWPTQIDLVGTYCRIYADMLWGRSQSGDDSKRLITIRLDPKVPKMKPHTAVASDVSEYLNLFWMTQGQVLRENGVIQQWAGGAIIKVSWNPWLPTSVYGISLETIQPETYYPIYDPTNYRNLIAVLLKFKVGVRVAMDKYNLTKDEIAKLATQGDTVEVTEYWDRNEYMVVVGRNGKGSGVIARYPDGTPMAGPNTIRNPVTGQGLIPVVYIPRYVDGSFYGKSLASLLSGVQGEYNKLLADLGDALNRASHPSGAVSDYHGAKGRHGGGITTVPVAKGGLIDFGITPPGMEPPKVHEFPGPEVPSITPNYASMLMSSADFMTGMTEAARGVSQGAEESGLAKAAAMLPTLNAIDAMRENWNTGLAQAAGLDTIIMAMWYSRPMLALVDFVPEIPVSAFRLNQWVDWRPILPRDKAAIIDEVVRLSTARSVSPQEWLRRLGDIEDLDEEYQRLILNLMLMAQIEAAVAGRELSVKFPAMAEGQQIANSPDALPEVSVKDPAALAFQANRQQNKAPANAQTNSKQGAS